MLSESTVRLVDDVAALGAPELVQIKGADKPLAAHRLLVWRKSITGSGVLSRTWSVGSGRCPPLKACWSVQSMARAQW